MSQNQDQHQKDIEDYRKVVMQGVRNTLTCLGYGANATAAEAVEEVKVQMGEGMAEHFQDMLTALHIPSDALVRDILTEDDDEETIEVHVEGEGDFQVKPHLVPETLRVIVSDDVRFVILSRNKTHLGECRVMGMDPEAWEAIQDALTVHFNVSHVEHWEG